MALTWYISLYTKTGNAYTFDDYEECESYEDAKEKTYSRIPPHPAQFYRVEHKEVLGQLATIKRYKTPKHEKYSNNKIKATFQQDADNSIDNIKERIRGLSSDSSVVSIKSIIKDIQFYKKVWTKEQYNSLMQELLAQPCCTKLLYEYDKTHHTSKYIY